MPDGLTPQAKEFNSMVQTLLKGGVMPVNQPVKEKKEPPTRGKSVDGKTTELPIEETQIGSFKFDEVKGPQEGTNERKPTDKDLENYFISRILGNEEPSTKKFYSPPAAQDILKTPEKEVKEHFEPPHIPTAKEKAEEFLTMFTEPFKHGIESLEKTGEGIKEITKGEFKTGFNKAVEGYFGYGKSNLEKLSLPFSTLDFGVKQIPDIGETLTGFATLPPAIMGNIGRNVTGLATDLAQDIGIPLSDETEESIKSFAETLSPFLIPELPKLRGLVTGRIKGLVKGKTPTETAAIIKEEIPKIVEMAQDQYAGLRDFGEPGLDVIRFEEKTFPPPPKSKQLDLKSFGKEEGTLNADPQGFAEYKRLEALVDDAKVKGEVIKPEIFEGAKIDPYLPNGRHNVNSLLVENLKTEARDWNASQQIKTKTSAKVQLPENQLEGGVPKIITAEELAKVSDIENVSRETLLTNEGKQPVNRIIADDVYQEALNRIKGNVNSKLYANPFGAYGERFKDYVTVGAYYFESGLRNAAQWTRKMIEEFGEDVKPYLKDILDTVKKDYGEVIRENEKERGFITTLKDSDLTDPVVRSSVEGVYNVISNKQSLRDAADLIREAGSYENAAFQLENPLLSDRVKNTLGQVLIEKFSGEGDRLFKAGDKVNSDLYYNRAIDIAEKISRRGTELGQAVQVYSMWNRLTPQGILRYVEKEIGKYNAKHKKQVQLTPKQARELLQQAEKIQEMPEGFQKQEATKELFNKITEITPPTFWDKYWGLRYASMLSGLSTQAINALGSLSSLITESMSVALRNPKEFPSAMIGLYNGLGKGVIESLSILKKGGSFDKLETNRVLERVRFKGGNWNPFNYAKFVGRFMEATDMFFNKGLSEMEATGLAREINRKRGLRGKDLQKAVINELNNSSEFRLLAEQQATNEGLTGLDKRRRVNELIEQYRDENIIDHAESFGKYGTYNYDPQGTIGAIAKGVANITKDIPYGKVVVAFTRIVGNALNNALDVTPYGYKRAFLPGYNRAIKIGSREFYQQVARATLGTLAMGTLAAVMLKDFSDDSDFDISGNGTGDWRKDAQVNKIRPNYSVKLFGKWFNYRPWTTMFIAFNVIGNIKDAIRYGKFDNKDLLERIGVVAGMTASSFMNMSFLQSVNNWWQGLANEEKFSGLVKQLISGEVRILTPNLIRQIAQIFDPNLYEANDIKQMMWRSTPITGGLKKKLNILGEEVERESRFVPETSKDPVWKFLVENKIFISTPRKTLQIGNRFIEDDEYYRLIKESGPMIRKRIAENLPMLEKLSEEQRKSFVKNIVKAERKRVIGNIRRETKSDIEMKDDVEKELYSPE